MLKKATFVALAAVAVACVLSFTGLGSYASTAWGKFRKSASHSVSVEFEIERLRGEVAKLGPDLKKNRSIIAEEIVGIKNLKEEISTARTGMEKEKDALRKLTQALDSGEKEFVSAGISRDRKWALEKLDRDVASLKRAEEGLSNKEKLVEEKERRLEAAKEELRIMIGRKEELNLRLAKLETKVQQVRQAQSKGACQLDDRRLAEIDKALKELETRVQVEETEVQLQGQFPTEPVSVGPTAPVKSASEVTREAREYLEPAKVADKK